MRNILLHTIHSISCWIFWCWYVVWRNGNSVATSPSGWWVQASVHLCFTRVASGITYVARTNLTPWRLTSHKGREEKFIRAGREDGCITSSRGALWSSKSFPEPPRPLLWNILNFRSRGRDTSIWLTRDHTFRSHDCVSFLFIHHTSTHSR